MWPRSGHEPSFFGLSRLEESYIYAPAPRKHAPGRAEARAYAKKSLKVPKRHLRETQLDQTIDNGASLALCRHGPVHNNSRAARCASSRPSTARRAREPRTEPSERPAGRRGLAARTRCSGRKISSPCAWRPEKNRSRGWSRSPPCPDPRAARPHCAARLELQRRCPHAEQQKNGRSSSNLRPAQPQWV